jgi:hypothetical protein
MPKVGLLGGYNAARAYGVSLGNWTYVPTSYSWQISAYGNGKFLLIDENNFVCATSVDGVTWTIGSLPTGEIWESVAYGNGVFVALGLSGKTIVSSDGLTWTGYSSLSHYEGWTHIAFGNGFFTAVADVSPGVGVSAISTNGFTWTVGSTISTVFSVWINLVFGNGYFLAATNRASETYYVISTDGLTWSSPHIISQFPDVVFGAGVFLNYSLYSGVGPFVAISTSPDGYHWVSTQTVTPDYNLFAGNNNLFIALGTSLEYAFSFDGMNFVSKPIKYSGWQVLQGGNKTFVAVSQANGIIGVYKY